MSEQEKVLKHFYQFCFVLQRPGLTQYISQPIQLDNQNLSLVVLRAVKKSMNVPDDAVMIAATYLGQMTLEEFNPPARGGMDATDEYLAGLKIGMENIKGVENPYPLGTVENLDWRNGRIKGAELYEATPKQIDGSPTVE